MACAFVADVARRLGRPRWPGREAPGAPSPAPGAGLGRFLAAPPRPGRLAELRRRAGPRHLDDDFELVRETFHRFAEEKVRPHAEHVHRTNGDIPEEIIAGLAEIGRIRAVGPRGVRRVRHRGRERLPGHGGGHRGAQLGLARHRRLAHHPARDPDPGPGARRHRGAEAELAAQLASGRGAGGGGGDRARLRLRRGQHRDRRHARPRGAGW